MGSPGTSNNRAVSTDGITWITQAINNGFVTSGLASNGLGTFYVRSIRTAMAQYSTNGTTWVFQTNIYPSNRFEHAHYLNGLYILTGRLSSGAMSPFIITSSDGINWTQRTTPLTTAGQMAYGNGVYVLTRGKIGDDLVLVSTDLVSWTAYSIGVGSQWDYIIFANGSFVVTNPLITGVVKVATSPDGINWTTHNP